MAGMGLIAIAALVGHGVVILVDVEGGILDAELKRLGFFFELRGVRGAELGIGRQLFREARILLVACALEARLLIAGSS